MHLRSVLDLVFAMSVVVEAPADEVTARAGRWAEVRARTPASCTMTMDTDSLDGPLFVLGAIGADFTVVSPVELATTAADWGRRYSRAGLDPSAAAFTAERTGGIMPG